MSSIIQSNWSSKTSSKSTLKNNQREQSGIQKPLASQKNGTASRTRAYGGLILQHHQLYQLSTCRHQTPLPEGIGDSPLSAAPKNHIKPPEGFGDAPLHHRQQNHHSTPPESSGDAPFHHRHHNISHRSKNAITLAPIEMTPTMVVRQDKISTPTTWRHIMLEGLRWNGSWKLVFGLRVMVALHGVKIVPASCWLIRTSHFSLPSPSTVVCSIAFVLMTITVANLSSSRSPHPLASSTVYSSYSLLLVPCSFMFLVAWVFVLLILAHRSPSTSFSCRRPLSFPTIMVDNSSRHNPSPTLFRCSWATSQKSFPFILKLYRSPSWCHKNLCRVHLAFSFHLLIVTTYLPAISYIHNHHVAYLISFRSLH